MTHPLEEEFLTICQAAFGDEWTPEMRLGEPVIEEDGSLSPTLIGVEPGRQRLDGKKAHRWRFDREVLVALAAGFINERSRKIRDCDTGSLAAKRLGQAAA